MRRPKATARLVIVASALLLVSASAVLPLRAEDEAIDIRSRLISHFKVGSDETRFGEFEFLGGLELSSSSASLGGMSAIRLSEGRDSFLGVMDTGFWYAGRLERNENGVLTGVSDFSVSPILDADGAASDEKWRFDAEGLMVRGDEVLVSFERNSRVDIYPARAPGGSRPTGSLPLLIPLEEFRSNRGLETITVAPEASALAGAVVVVSEKSLNQSGDIYAAILNGPSKGVFFSSSVIRLTTSPTEIFCPTGICCCWSGASPWPGESACGSAASTAAGWGRGTWWMDQCFWKPISVIRSTTWKAWT